MHFFPRFCWKEPDTNWANNANGGEWDEWRRTSTAFNHKHNCLDYVRVLFPFLSIVLLRQCFFVVVSLALNLIRSFVNIHYHCDCGQTMSRSIIQICCATSDDARQARSQTSKAFQIILYRGFFSKCNWQWYWFIRGHNLSEKKGRSLGIL